MKKYHLIRSFAREHRKNQTPAEKFFWQRVRNRKLGGYKFNRQFIIEYGSTQDQYFIVDFYCHQKGLIVELDGPIHNFQKAQDRNRTDILQGLGFKVIRFKNEQVLSEWLLVREELLRILNNTSSSRK